MSNPTNGVWQLESDLDGETQSGPAPFVGTEPIRFADGLWLEQGTTNLCANPWAIDTDRWFSTDAVLTPVTDVVPDGAFTAMRVVTDASSTFEWSEALTDFGAIGGSTLARTFSFSCWAKLALGEMFNLVAAMPLTRGGGFLNFWTDAVVVGTGAFERYSITVTTTAGDSLDYPIALYMARSYGVMRAATTYYVTGVNIEELPYATSACPEQDVANTPNDGYDYTGTANNSTSTRAASSAAIDPTGILSPNSGAVAFWATRQVDTNSEEYWIIAGSGGSGNDLFFASITSDRLDHKWNCDNAGVDEDNAGADFPVGVPTFFIMGWDGTTTYTKQGGNALQSSVRNTPADNWGDDTFTLQCSAGGVIFHELAFFSEMPTDAQVATLESTMNWSMSTLSGSSRIASQFQLRPY